MRTPTPVEPFGVYADDFADRFDPAAHARKADAGTEFGAEAAPVIGHAQHRMFRRDRGHDPQRSRPGVPDRIRYRFLADAVEGFLVVERLRLGHESLATQMAENLRVLATARTVTEDLLTDVAKIVGQQNQARTYGRGGANKADPAASARGIAINRAL